MRALTKNDRSRFLGRDLVRAEQPLREGDARKKDNNNAINPSFFMRFPPRTMN